MVDNGKMKVQVRSQEASPCTLNELSCALGSESAGESGMKLVPGMICDVLPKHSPTLRTSRLRCEASAFPHGMH